MINIVYCVRYMSHREGIIMDVRQQLLERVASLEAAETAGWAFDDALRAAGFSSNESVIDSIHHIIWQVQSRLAQCSKVANSPGQLNEISVILGLLGKW